MTVDLQPRDDGRMHFSLGPVEKWIAGIIGAAMVYVCYWLVSSVQSVLTQQAVTNSQLTTISAQLTDVPQLRAQNAELKIKVERLEADVMELRKLRSLK